MNSVRNIGLPAAVRELLAHCTPARRQHLRLVMALMVLGAFAELAAIGAVLPFLSLLVDPERAMQIEIVARLFRLLGAEGGRELVLAATILFVVTAVAAGAVRLSLIWTSQAFVFRFGHELGVDLHRRVLHQPYTYHVMNNSSQSVALLEKVNALVFSVILPSMLAASAILISLFIVIALIAIDPFVAIVAALSFCLIYFFVSRMTRHELGRNASLINNSYAERAQAAQESSGAIRDIILDSAHGEYVRHFAAIDQRLRSAQIVNSFIGAAPRFIMETAGMVLIALLALLLSGREGGIAAAIPVLGALALGAQRLLPLLQQVYYGWAQLKGHEAVIYDVLAMMRLPLPSGDDAPPPPLHFARELRFEGVSYAYPGRDEAVLSAIDLVIPAGARVAFIGKTGSGKSTLVDLMMGLLEPSTGQILLDGVPLDAERRRAWQAGIAHVPQSIFLSDASVARNIAFGVPADQIDAQRVEAAARQAQLDDFVRTLPGGYDAPIGERGVRLSGGQRQRLGIARALYKPANVLVLDEATSALDDTTEAQVMQSLRGLDDRLTVVMIAHRLSTIASCDLVVRLEAGRIVQIGSYETVVKGLRVKTA